MALIKLKEAGVFNSTGKVGNWEVPQEIGGDIPKGSHTYNSLQITKHHSLFGNFVKKFGGFEINNSELLIKGLISVGGHLFELEDDLDLTGQTQVIIGINRNTDGSETERATYIDVLTTPRETIQEELDINSGIYEVVLFEYDGANWLDKFPYSKTIKQYLEAVSFVTGSKNVYDIEFTSFPDIAVTNPSLYTIENLSITVYVSSVIDNDNKNYLRIRKGLNFIDIEIDSDGLVEGKNEIFLYKNDTGTILATTGRAK